MSFVRKLTIGLAVGGAVIAALGILATLPAVAVLGGMGLGAAGMVAYGSATVSSGEALAALREMEKEDDEIDR